jgi:hypothetical protein
LNADKIIVLSDWPGEVLLLDLRVPGKDRIGLCKLYYDGVAQDSRWNTEGLWWADADTFFGNLHLWQG